MFNEKFKGTIESAYGQTLQTPLKFEGSFDAFGVEKPTSDADHAAAIEEIKAKNEFPKDEDIVNFVNNKRKANARQKSMQAAMDAAGIVKPTLETDEQLQLRTIYKALVASGKYTDEKAKEIASTTLGVQWAE